MAVISLRVAAAAIAAPAVARGASCGQSRGGERDLLIQYPKPPFKSQSQQWPGLAGLVDSRPDHGEASYGGSGRLMRRKALITGGDSSMGRAAAIACARQAADVAINHLPEEEPDAREVIDFIRRAGMPAAERPGP